VRTCPANARHFGDLADPGSAVSKMVAERGGIDLMPEQGTRPVNKYLPPRPRKPLSDSAAMLATSASGEAKGFFAWLDGVLDRI
jgi:Fe-S-cluster-containing dehydrogenase component